MFYITFPNNDEQFENFTLDKKVVKAVAMAVAGRHHLLLVGSVGTGMTMAAIGLKSLLPSLSTDEKKQVQDIYKTQNIKYKTLERPFRFPHSTSTIEGMFGGGSPLHCGEISLAHNGVLFLDHAQEYKTTVIQMLRVPLDEKKIYLYGKGRSAIYPANFQLVMTALPCPCGNYGIEDRVCLCTSKSIELFNKKLEPLTDVIPIRMKVNKIEEKSTYTSKELQAMIKTAIKLQCEKGRVNNDIQPYQYRDYYSQEMLDFVGTVSEENHLSFREDKHLHRVAVTVANMRGEAIPSKEDVYEALSFVNK